MMNPTLLLGGDAANSKHLIRIPSSELLIPKRTMAVFVEVDHVDRVFNLPDGGEYIALKILICIFTKGNLCPWWGTLAAANPPC